MSDKRLLALIAVLAIGAAVIFALQANQRPQTPAEKVAESVERVGDSVGEAVEEVGDEIDDHTDAR